MAQWLDFKNRVTGDGKTSADLMIYGEIGDYWEGLDASTLAANIKGLDADFINVRINSVGGSVFTAQAVYNLLRTSGKTINVFIDGMAASAATIISSAGDTVNMPENTIFMIHNPMISAWGVNAQQMREAAEILDKVRETILAVYRNKTGLDDAKLIELMDAETYLTAQEAKDFGFVDEITEPFQIAASMKNGVLNVNNVSMNASNLKNIPKSFLASIESNKIDPPEVEMNLQDLKAKHADVYEQAKAEGKQEALTSANASVVDAVKAERDRISSIHAAVIPGNEEMAQKAIDDGITAGDFALAQIKAEKEKGTDFLAKRKEDSKSLDNVENNGNNPGEGDPDDEIVNAIANSFNKLNGVKA